jgi:tubulin-specific chaperone A
MRLQKYADSIIIKGVHSPERLLSEATLFLHQVESKMPKSKQKILKMMHRKEEALSGKKVLIVDDDMRNVFALTSVLEEASVKVIVGRNGREGLEQLDNNTDINLVLMDIMMPEMDGYEAMKQIRNNQKYRKLPIIALTAKAMKDDRDKCINAGANDYLTKPVDTDRLLSLLRVWMYN